MTVRLLLVWRQVIAVPVPRFRSPRRARVAARRAVFWGVAAFVAATVGYAAALDTCLASVRYPEHGYRLAAIRQLQARQPERPLVVVIGSSRTQMAIDPSAMGFESEAGSPAVFNYGLTGTITVHLPAGYRRLRRAGVKPAAVVVELFPAVLTVPHASLVGDQVPRLTGTELLALDPRDRDRALAANWLKSRCLSWSHFRQRLQLQMLPGWLPAEVQAYNRVFVPDRFGFRPFYTDDIPDDERRGRTDLATRSYRSACQDLNPSPQATRAVRELVTACRADGVPVAFYVTPESPLFHGWYTPASRAALAAFVQMLTDELGVPVFDTSGGWTEAEFLDGHHMMPAGAARFSRSFADTHLRPWFATIFPAH